MNRDTDLCTAYFELAYLFGKNNLLMHSACVHMICTLSLLCRVGLFVGETHWLYEVKVVSDHRFVSRDRLGYQCYWDSFGSTKQDYIR